MDLQSQIRLRREEEERELLGKQMEALKEKQTRIQAERSARAEQARLAPHLTEPTLKT
jgi:hypothetical protein